MKSIIASIGITLAVSNLGEGQSNTSSPGTPSVLPRPDFHFPGNVGRTYADSDPAQFPQPVQAPKGAPNEREGFRRLGRSHTHCRSTARFRATFKAATIK